MNEITSFGRKNHIGIGIDPLCGQKLQFPRSGVEVRLQDGCIEEKWDSGWVKDVTEVYFCQKCSKILKKNDSKK